MSYQCIEVTKKNHVTSVLLNRPKAMNSITPEMHHELQDAFDEFSVIGGQYT
jgi:enoyl-CoA hydratase/carnithine racemase